MPNRQLLLISPYRLPTHSQVYLNAEEMAAWLNGYLMLWHPALLLDCPRPPSVASPYDHERPNPGQVFAVPENPTLYVPDDWGERIRAAGALRFTASPSREATRDHLKAALADPGGFATPDVTGRLLDLPDEAIADFYAVGFGYLVVDALFDAMDHDKLLDVDRFWAAVQSALVALVNGRADTTTAGLRQAAQTLQEAREVLYSMPVHVLDFWLGDPARFAEQVQHLLSRDLPVNLLANATLLRGLASAHPLLCEQLRQKIGQSVEVCGGTLIEREDSLLPLESQLWNLRRGQVVSREVLGEPVRVHARRRSSWHAQSPSFLQAAGLTHALLVAFDGALVPAHRATVINWPGPDGKQVDAFCRVPFNAHEPQTFFNLVYHLRQTITQDTAPTLALQHRGEAPFVCYHDWQRLSQLAQVFGHWTTLSRYFTDALAGEYASPALPDDFAMEYLEERIAERRPDPVSAFARHARARRRLDGVWTLAGFYRALAGAAGFGEALADCEALSRVEDQLEELATTGEPALHAAMQDDLAKLETAFAQRLARRLLARATSEQPGYLLLNPCSFPRRVALELDPFPGPVPLAEPIKAAQFDPDKTRLVVEVPALGFAWFPRRPTSNTSPPRARVKTAEGNLVRNEYFEAEIDPATGGLRFLRDLRFRSKRLGQQLVYNPGSSLKLNWPDHHPRRDRPRGDRYHRANPRYSRGGHRAVPPAVSGVGDAASAGNPHRDYPREAADRLPLARLLRRPLRLARRTHRDPTGQRHPGHAHRSQPPHLARFRRAASGQRVHRHFHRRVALPSTARQADARCDSARGRGANAGFRSGHRRGPRKPDADCHRVYLAGHRHPDRQRPAARRPLGLAVPSGYAESAD
jgi:hypothetical protein